MAKDNSVIIIPKLNSTMVFPKQTAIKTSNTNLQKIKEISNSFPYFLGVKSIKTSNPTLDADEQVGVTYYLLKGSDSKVYLITTQFTDNVEYLSSVFTSLTIKDNLLKEPKKLLTGLGFADLNNQVTTFGGRSYVLLETLLEENDFDSNEKYYKPKTRQLTETSNTTDTIFNQTFKKVGTVSYRNIDFAKDFITSYESLVQANVLESHSKIVEVSKTLLSQIEVRSPETANTYYLEPFDERLLYGTSNFLAPYLEFSIDSTTGVTTYSYPQVGEAGQGLSRGVVYADNLFMPYRLIRKAFTESIGSVVTYYDEKFNDYVNDFLKYYVPSNNIVITEIDQLNAELQTISKSLTDILSIESKNRSNINTYTLIEYSELGYEINGTQVNYYITVRYQNGDFETVTPKSINFIQVGNDFLDSYRKESVVTVSPPSLGL